MIREWLIPWNVPAPAVVATGTSQASATSISTKISNVISGSGGVIIPVAEAGRQIYVFNQLASSLNIYPAISGIIDSNLANAPLVLPSGVGCLLTAIDNLHWVSKQLGIASSNSNYYSENQYALGSGLNTYTASLTNTPSSYTL